MQYPVKKPDGAEVQSRSRDDFVIAYNAPQIDAAWPAKADAADERISVGNLLAVTPATAAGAISGARGSPGARKQGLAVDQDALVKRYLDAYRVARATVAIIGLVLRALALCLAGLCLFAALAGGNWSIANQLLASTGPVLMGAVAAVAAGVPLYARGILVCAIGQVLRATLDTAVGTSPFFDQDRMAQIVIRC
jgi:hypothetical protein